MEPKGSGNLDFCDVLIYFTSGELIKAISCSFEAFFYKTWTEGR